MDTLAIAVRGVWEFLGESWTGDPYETEITVVWVQVQFGDFYQLQLNVRFGDHLAKGRL